MVSYLLIIGKVLFGGRMSASCWQPTKGWLLLLSEMAHPVRFGLTPGLTCPCFKGFQSFFSCVREQLLLVQNVYQSLDFFDLFHLPLSDEAFAQSHELSDIIEVIDLQAGNDLWSFIWGSIQFASNRAYSHMSGVRQVHLVYSWIWKSSCQPKPKVFFWLLLKDRLNTRELLKRKNMALEDYNCVLYHNVVQETLDHLFLNCAFTRNCWSLLVRKMDPRPITLDFGVWWSTQPNWTNEFASNCFVVQ